MACADGSESPTTHTRQPEIDFNANQGKHA
jgi:hypothetical protein